MNSEFKQIHRDILLEWVYDSKNLILEPYKILTNSKDLINSYISYDSTITNNNQDNSLVLIDAPSNKFGKVDTSRYTFLSIKEYVSPTAIQHDRVKIYLPVNYKFGEYQGFYLRLYTYDFFNKKLFEISNLFIDVNDLNQLQLIKTLSNPILYQDKVWDRFIELNVPSVYSIALQRDSNGTIPDSVNYNLTDGIGLSQTAPIFIDFRFISKVTTIAGVSTYLTTQKVIQQIPQIPQLQALSLYMQEAVNGDYFEIYPMYNGTFENFVLFIDSSLLLGRYYYLEFDITVFEENIKGKTLTYRIENDFTEIVEFRPIIKYSSTKAIIDVEMKLINKDDGNIVTRKAAYGLKPDQLSKYLINSKKINVRDTFKPKIYSKNQFSLYSIDAIGKTPNVQTEISVPVPELLPIVGKFVENEKIISAYSRSALNRTSSNKIENYHLMGKMKIGIRPFDNIFKFILAFKSVGESNTLEPVDLTNCQDLKLIFKSDDKMIEFSQYFTGETAPKFGVCQFRIDESKFLDIKNLNKLGSNVFYITTTNQGFRNILYSGLFTILDTAQSVGELETNSTGIDLGITVVADNVAIATRRINLESGKNSSGKKDLKIDNSNNNLSSKYGISRKKAADPKPKKKAEPEKTKEQKASEEMKNARSNSGSSGNVEQDKKNSEQMKNARRNSGSSGNVEQDKKNSEQMRNRRK